VQRLFGTDGIRGEAYEPPLDRDTVARVGRALAQELRPDAPHILIGRDTRASGADIECWLTDGILAGGGRATSAGVVPTPAVAFLTRARGFDAGVVLSASHNPYHDNGIKIFSADGVKTSESLEDRIESHVRDASPPVTGASSSATPSLHLESLYLDHVATSLGDVSLPPLKVALDCANGAGYRVGPKLLESLGIDVVPLSTEPDGKNINRGCGSTHLEPLARAVVAEGCDFGAALDGDGDRLLLVDSTGRSVDGDQMLLLTARHLEREGRLTGHGVVATVMSNMALELALAEDGIQLYRTRVGDKFVAEEMLERQLVLGGEQSGHIIFADYASTGDGLLTLTQVLRVIARAGRKLDELAGIEPFPQVLVNVPVRARPDVRDVPEIADAIAAAEKGLDGRGRVLIRYSGTEPLLRIMMEGPEAKELDALVASVRNAVERSIGRPQ